MSILGSIASIAVETAAALFLRAGLRILSKVDQRSFGSPVTFTTIYVVVLPVLLGFLQLFFGYLPRFVNVQQPPGQLPSSSDIVSILLFIGILTIGGVLTLVGAIGGAILGTWRLGARYGKGPLKVASILYVIPILQLAAPVIFVLTFERMRRIDATEPPSQRP